MSANINIDSPLNFTSGEISFQQLKNTFGGGDAEGKNIKFSDYARDTSDNEDPIVPDSTENFDIASKDFSDSNDTVEDLSIETFRDSNKYYHVTFTGIAAQKEFESHFNNNLTKNIKKRLDIGSSDGTTAGTLVSGDNTQYAATLTTENIRNLNMDINEKGAIYGAAGPQGASAGASGTDGGSALHLNTGAGNRNFRFNIKTSEDNSNFGKVYAGGGGGTAGVTYHASPYECRIDVYRYKVRNAAQPPDRRWVPANPTTVTIHSSDGRGCSRRRGLRRYDIPGPGPGYNTSGGPLRGWSSTLGRGKAGSQCYHSYTKTIDGYDDERARPNRTDADEIKENASKTITAPSGIGGYGGGGQGWIGGITGSIQAAQDGGSGSPGGKITCRSQRYRYPPGSQTQAFKSKAGQRVSFGGDFEFSSAPDGGPGGSGATWGKRNTGGGQGGTAIVHNGGITWYGDNDDTLKGRFSKGN